MAGREEQKRRQFAVARESNTARLKVLREIYDLCKLGDLDLVTGFVQSQLGITKPFSEIRKTLQQKPVVCRLCGHDKFTPRYASGLCRGFAGGYGYCGCKCDFGEPKPDQK